MRRNGCQFRRMARCWKIWADTGSEPEKPPLLPSCTTGSDQTVPFSALLGPSIGGWNGEQQSEVARCGADTTEDADHEASHSSAHFGASIGRARDHPRLARNVHERTKLGGANTRLVFTLPPRDFDRRASRAAVIFFLPLFALLDCLSSKKERDRDQRRLSDA